MDAIFDAFKTRAEAVSAEVHRFPHKSTAFDFIVAMLRKEGLADVPRFSAVWVDGSFLTGIDKGQLAESLPGLSFNVTREKAADAKIGISQLDWGIANTGTLVQDAAAVELRLASTLPNIHVAIVDTNKILPDLPAIFAKVTPIKTNYLSMITGPSRTADIERVLTIGVHGPERLIIVCVDGLEEAN
jgi:L-lactate dehydrogenase complex protein LldG